ncbi:MAG: hemolysin family protein [Phycisphaerales bacterium]|nr:hemolysin family protein [Phycisphaerales bacterium]
MDLVALAIMGVCLGLGTLFSALHACLENTTGAALEEAAKGPRGEVRSHALMRIAPSIDAHAYAVALVRILANLGVAVSAVFVSASLRGVAGFDDAKPAPELLDALLGVVIAGALLWILGVSVSESIGRHAPERFVRAFAAVVRGVYLLQKPLAPVATLIDTLIRKLAGASVVNKQQELSAEILSITEEGEREGVIDEGERRMIEAVVNFKSRTVEQIMTPRSEIEALEYTNNLGQITAFVRRVRHSRVPVYRTGGGLDDVIGFFYVKDLLRWLAGDTRGGATSAVGGGFELKQILRQALHVPHSKTIRELADEFVAKKVHVAVVVDEYGAIVGLVSLEDIIEDVFGDIQDEYEKTEEEPRIEIKLDEDMIANGPRSGLADIDARAYVQAANEAMEPLGVNIPESDDYDTVGGFVLSTLGHIPEVNETFSHGRMTITVLEATPTRVLRVRVQARPEMPTDEQVAAQRMH